MKQKRRYYENAVKNKMNDCLEKKVKYEETEKIMGLSRTMFYSADEKQSKKILGELKIYQVKYPKLIELSNLSLEKLLTH